jgi:polyhydroxyalkanoate synthesis regulator phasin
MRKTIAAIATAAIILGGFSVALVVQSPEVASAQEAETPETVRGTVADVLAELVENGVITDEQATQVSAALRERLGAFRGHRGFARGFHLETAAEVIGIDVADLGDALRNGQTVAEVAEANSVSVQAVIDALVAEINSHLDQAVEDGKLTAERADEIRSTAPDRIDSMVNGELEYRPGLRSHRGMGPQSGLDLDDPTGSPPPGA